MTLAPGATELSLIGTATQRNQDTIGRVNFTDGTSVDYPIQYGDWCGSAKFGNVVALEMAYRLNGTGTDGCHAKLFATAPLTIPAGKTVESVTLPTQTGDPATAGRIHVFAIADNGAALTIEPPASQTAPAGTPTELDLGTIGGGIPDDGAGLLRPRAVGRRHGHRGRRGLRDRRGRHRDDQRVPHLGQGGDVHGPRAGVRLPVRRHRLLHGDRDLRSPASGRMPLSPPAPTDPRALAG